MKKLVVMLLAMGLVIALAAGSWAASSFTDSESVTYNVTVGDVLFIDIVSGNTVTAALIGSVADIEQGYADLPGGNTLRCWAMTTYNVTLGVVGVYAPFDAGAGYVIPNGVTYWVSAREGGVNYWDVAQPGPHNIVPSTAPTTPGHDDYWITYRMYLSNGGHVLDLDDGDFFAVTYTFTMNDL